jgi:Fe-S oxidoreductase
MSEEEDTTNYFLNEDLGLCAGCGAPIDSCWCEQDYDDILYEMDNS